MRTGNKRKQGIRVMLFAAVFSIFSAFASQAVAQPVYEQDVRAAVSNWLQLKSAHFGEELGNTIVCFLRWYSSGM